jgi:FkbM family methyltransferase
MAGPRLLRAYADARPDATFVEIGANDGEQHDFLRPLLLEGRLRGVMVEPVPYVFARLCDNYAALAGRVALEQAAVAEHDGTAELWHLREPEPGEPGLPDWYDGVGSLRRDAVERHAAQIPGLAERLVRAEVPALTFDALCAKHGLQRVDLIVIDTEGHDWAILRSIDLARHRPDVVVFEHFHLDPADRAAAREHLAAHGYATHEEGFDTFCVHRDAPVANLPFRPAVPGVAKHDER